MPFFDSIHIINHNLYETQREKMYTVDLMSATKSYFVLQNLVHIVMLGPSLICRPICSQTIALATTTLSQPEYRWVCKKCQYPLCRDADKFNRSQLSDKSRTKSFARTSLNIKINCRKHDIVYCYRIRFKIVFGELLETDGQKSHLNCSKIMTYTDTNSDILIVSPQ